MRKNPFRKDIEFTRHQSITLGILCLLLLMSYIVTIFYKPELYKDQGKYILKDIITKKEIKLDSSSHKKIKKITSGKRKSKGKIYFKPPPKYVNFDPNKTDSMTWIQMGLSPFTTKVINNYLRKGGQFWDCEGLAKIYSLDSVTFQNILPYCQIPPRQKKYESRKSNKYPKRDSIQNYSPDFRKKIVSIDIAIADTTELMSLYGIGSTLSGRIVRYRDRLGGFHSIDQLKEVYGLEQEVIDGFSDKLSITPLIKKIYLIADPTKLVKHPYIEWPHANIISKYIQQNGPITDTSTFLKIHGLPEEMVNKIIPYLNFQKEPNASSMNN